MQNLQTSRDVQKRDLFCLLLILFSIGGLLAAAFGGFANVNKTLLYQEFGIASNTLLQGFAIASVFIGALLSSAFLGNIRRRLPWIKAATFVFVLGRIVTATSPNFLVFLLGQIITGAAIGCYMVMVNAFVSRNASSEARARTYNAFTQPAIQVFVVAISVIGGAITGGAWRPTTLIGACFALPLLVVLFAFAPREQVEPRSTTARTRLTGKAFWMSLLFPSLNQGASQPNVILNFVGLILLASGAPSSLIPVLAILYTVAGVVGSGISAYVWGKMEDWGLSPKVPLIVGCLGISAVLVTIGLQTMGVMHLPWQAVLIVALAYNVLYPPSAGSGYFAGLQLQYDTDAIAARGNAVASFACNAFTVIGILAFQGWEQYTRTHLTYLNPYLTLGVLMGIASILALIFAASAKAARR